MAEEVQRKNVKVYILEDKEARSVVSKFSPTGKTVKFFTSVLSEGVVTTLSSFKVDHSLKMKRDSMMKILKAQVSKWGIEIKNDSIIMDTQYALTEDEEDLRRTFIRPPLVSLGNAASVPLHGRISIGPATVDYIGDLTKGSMHTRREIHISQNGRSALVTLWGEKAEETCLRVNCVYNIMCVKAANEFRGQRAYNSTQNTIFEIMEEQKETATDFEGVVESVSFENNLIEVEGDILSINQDQREALFPDHKYVEGRQVSGKKRSGEVVEMSIIKKKKE